MDAWLVLLGAVIAGAVSIGGEVLRGHEETDLDGSRRANDRQIERDRIQRETLLELQEALGTWMRAQVQIQRAAARDLRNTGRLGMLEEELDRTALESTQRFLYLTERVKNDHLRNSLNRLRGLFIPVNVSSEAEANAAGSKLIAEAVVTQKQLGEVLRAYL